MGRGAVVPDFDGAVFSCGDEDVAGGPCDGGGGAEGGGGGGVSWEGVDRAQGGFVEEVDRVGGWRGGECVGVGEGGGVEDVGVCREGCGREGRGGEVEEVVRLDELDVGHGNYYVITQVGVPFSVFFFFVFFHFHTLDYHLFDLDLYGSQPPTTTLVLFSFSWVSGDIKLWFDQVRATRRDEMRCKCPNHPSHTAPRLHRVPPHLDYTLIPAPLSKCRVCVEK